MTEKIYTVRACRYGDPEGVSYMVGVFKDEGDAKNAADCERTYRGGKYECEVLEWDLSGEDGECCYDPEVICEVWV